MSKVYDKTALSFKSVNIDTKVLDAQKILVRPKDGSFDDRVDILDIVGSSSSAQGGENYYTEYNTSVFQFGVESVQHYTTSSVRFDSSHMPKGVIKKVSFYGRDAESSSNDSKVNGCYLLAKVYKKDTGELVRSHSSTNGKVKVLEKQSGSSERPLNTWVFDGFESIAEDEIIKFIPSSDGINQSNGYYFGVCVDSTHTHANCQIGGDGDFVNNPLATGAKYLALGIFEGDFYYDVNPCVKEHEKTFLRNLFTVSKQSVFNNNINNESLGVGSIKAFVLERPYITNGSFDEVRWQSSGTVNSTTYLKLTLRDRRGARMQSFVSVNNENFNNQGEKSFRFKKDFEVTDDVGSIMFETCDKLGNVTSSQFRVRVIGNAQKPEAGGSEVTNNNFIINVIFYGKVATANDNILSKERADSLYAAKGGVTTGSYDWTPDYTNNIKLDVHEYTFPVNGWLVSRDWQYLVEQKNEIRIDDKPVGQVNDKGNFSILCKKDEVLTIESGLDVPFWFFPCKSEQYDYRVTHTEYDIWRGAVTTDAQGNTVVQDLYCPVATRWYGQKASSISIARVEDEVAYNSNGGFLCNIQSSEIVDGGGIFMGHQSMTSWDSDLQRLEDASGMFNHCYNLTTFTSDLSSLTDAERMFQFCNNLASFSSDLPSLTNGVSMFAYSKLSSFSTDLSSLTDGHWMFFYCRNLTTFSSNLSSLTNGDKMFDNCTKLESFDGDLSSLTDGSSMFSQCENLTTFTADLPSLTDGNSMFKRCTNLTTFTSDLSSLTDGSDMFDNCNKLTTFTSDLSSLTNGSYMFYSCYKLKSFTNNLSSLTDGSGMFSSSGLTTFTNNLSSLTDGSSMFSSCGSLTTFTSDLSSLTNGSAMFWNCPALTTFVADLSSLTGATDMFKVCKKLTTFTSDLSSLTGGNSMFYHCIALTSFSSDLSSLTNGNNMFRDCLLDAQSVERILTTIPDRGSEYTKQLNITMDIAACPKASEIVGLEGGQTIPQNPSEIPVRHRGWCCYLSCANGSYTVPSGISEFDVVEGSAYIPNASSWHNDREANGLTITRVENGIAYNDNN